MSITAADLYTLARAKIGLNFQDGRLDDNNVAGVNAFINSGLMDLCAETDWDWLYAEDSFLTAAGVETYGLPRNHLRTIWIADEQGRSLRLSQRRQAPRYFGVQTEPRFFSIANGTLYLSPVPNSPIRLRHGYIVHLSPVDVSAVSELDDIDLRIPPMWWNFAALFIAKHIALSLKDYNLHGAITSEMQLERQRLADNARRALGPMVPVTREDG